MRASKTIILERTAEHEESRQFILNNECAKIRRERRNAIKIDGDITKDSLTGEYICKLTWIEPGYEGPVRG